MNVLSSSFTSMQSFLNILLVRKKLTREKYYFYCQRTTNSTRRENENENEKRKRKRAVSEGRKNQQKSNKTIKNNQDNHLKIATQYKA